MADENSGQAGANALPGEPRDIRGDFLFDLGGDCGAVEYACH
jgi:hypothetical protein